MNKTTQETPGTSSWSFVITGKTNDLMCKSFFSPKKSIYLKQKENCDLLLLKTEQDWKKKPQSLSCHEHPRVGNDDSNYGFGYSSWASLQGGAVTHEMSSTLRRQIKMTRKYRESNFKLYSLAALWCHITIGLRSAGWSEQTELSCFAHVTLPSAQKQGQNTSKLSKQQTDWTGHFRSRAPQPFKMQHF